MNKTKKEADSEIDQTSGYHGERGGGRGNIEVGGKKGYYGIIWNHVYETFENCKAL